MSAAVPQHRETVTALNAPAAIGPYAQAIRAAGLLFCSGQIPLDPQTDELVDGDSGDQVRRCLENLAAVCTAAGTALSEAVRVTIYLTDIASFDQVNDVYGTFFEADPPARVAVAVSALPRGARVEIDAVVALTD